MDVQESVSVCLFVQNIAVIVARIQEYKIGTPLPADQCLNSGYVGKQVIAWMKIIHRTY